MNVTITRVVYDLGFGVLWKAECTKYQTYLVKDGDDCKVVNMIVGDSMRVDDLKVISQAARKHLKAFDKFFSSPEFNAPGTFRVDGESVEIEV